MGVGCVGLSLMQFAIYDVRRRAAAIARKRLSTPMQFAIFDGLQITLNGGLLLMACLAVFCLSVVGAVCDDAGLESCLGNSALHTIAAISFFILYDAYLIILATTQTPSRQGRSCGRRRAVFAALVALSIATKARYGLSAGVEAQPWVAVFEWLDVIACLVATLLYIDTNAEGVFFGTLRANCASTDVSADEEVSCILCTVTFHTNHAHNLTRSP